MAELPNLLVTRPNKAGEAPTLLFLSHRPGQVDFKINPVKQTEEGWEYFDTLADPETTGNFKLAVDGSTLDLYATAPRKWVMKFASEGGKWQCKSAEFPGTFAEPSDMKPAPSKLGAGGLPKGSINLGEQEEDVRFVCFVCVSARGTRARQRERLPKYALSHPPSFFFHLHYFQAFNPLGF